MESLPNLYPKITEFNFKVMRSDSTPERPAITSDYWYSIDWDVERLWRLDLPVERMPLAALAWHLDVPVWPDEARRPYSVTPRQVLENPAEHPTEFRRVNAASLDHPLEVFRNRDRLMILDGVHRLAKAHALGLKEVPVRHVPESEVRLLDH